MAIPGQFAVDDQGSATYHVPILVPPGTVGMIPEISLDYSSKGVDGIVGLGWRLAYGPGHSIKSREQARADALQFTGANTSFQAVSTFGQPGAAGYGMGSGNASKSGVTPNGDSLSTMVVIGRCAATIAQDGVHGGINLDANDKFCINGRRLLPTGSTDSSGGTIYGSEVEVFDKIVSYDSTGGAGPQYFRVWTKSGLIMEFGNTPDSHILAVGSVAVRTWALDKVSDRTGNFYTITYTNDTANGQFFPTRIDYTGNSNTSQQPYNSVQFSYNTSRPDVVPAYVGGSLQQTTVLLSDIKTYQGSNLVHDYQLQYRLGSNITHSRLISVTQCDGAGNCLPATSFEWQGGAGLSAMTAIPNPVPTDPNATPVPNSFAFGLMPGDFFHRGLTDYVAAKNTCFSAADANGKLMPTYLPVMKSTQTSAFTAVNMPVKTTVRGTGRNWPNCFYMMSDMFGGGYTTSVLLLDNNPIGPGYPPPDPLAAKSPLPRNGDPTLDGTGGIAVQIVTQFLQNDSNGNFVPFKSTSGAASFPAGDFLGIGRDSIFAVAGAMEVPTQVLTWNNGRNAFDGQQALPPSALYWCCREYTGGTSVNWSDLGEGGLLTGDFDGSGCTDVFLVGSTSIQQVDTGTLAPSGTVNSIWYGCGHSNNMAVPPFAAVPPLGQPRAQQGGGYFGLAGGYVGDFNGDGKSDVLYFPETGSTVTLELSTGTTFSSSSINLTDTNGSPVDLRQYQLVVGDWSGMGRQGIALISLTPGLPHLIYLSTGTGFVPVAAIPNNNTSLSWATAADWNNDGATDLWIQMSLDGAADTQYVFNFVPEYITKISNGIGETTTITYDRLNHGAIYTPGTDATYPTQDVVGPIYAVSTVAKSNGIGGTNNWTYAYAGAKRDLLGRGFLGFTSRIITDLQTHVVATINYRTDFPYTGEVLSETKVLNGVALNSTTNTPAATVVSTSTGTGITRYLVAQQASSESAKDVDGTAFPSGTTNRTYDSYGNVATENVSVSDGSSRSVTNTYLNDPVKWLIGLLTNTSVTTTVPDAPTTGTVGVNPPSASDYSVTATSNVTRTFDPRTNDSCSGSCTLSIVALGTPANGVAVINAGISVIYTSKAGFVGSDSFTYTISDGQGHTARATITVNVIQPASTTFTATPATITVGGSTTLNWAVSNGTSASIDNGVGNNLSLSGSQSVSPSVTTTYTLTAQNSIGTVTTKQVTVNVVPPPSITTFTSNPSSISSGGMVTLTWQISGATKASINNGVGNLSSVASGSVNVQPSTTSVYTLTAQNDAGTPATATTTVTVVLPAAVVSFTASPSTITQGSIATLNWAASGATSASINNGVGSVSPTSGSVNVSPTTTTTYTLSLTNSVGVVTTQPVTVTVVPPPVVNSFTASPMTVPAGGSGATLSWSVSGGASASINGTSVSASGGSMNVAPSITTTYTLTLANVVGTQVTRSVTVTVVPPPTGSLSASPTTITQGSNATLTWSASGATGASINGTNVSASGGSMSVSPTSTTTYTLTLTNAAGAQMTDSRTVTVVAPPSGLLSVNQTTMTQGGNVTLTWTASGATGASINGTNVSTSGGLMSVSPSSTTTYTLTLTNAAGSQATSSVTVTVVPPASGSLTANRTTIMRGQGTLMSWTGSNATSAAIDNGIGSVSPSGGSIAVQPNSTTTYTLTLTNAAGTPVTYQITITVTAGCGPAGCH